GTRARGGARLTGHDVAAMTMRRIEVALPLPLFRTFTYAVEEEPANPLVPGSRVVVPFRNRRAIGVCVGEADSSGTNGTRQLKAVLDVPDAFTAVSPPILELCRWIADYYVVPLGVALRSALP